MIKRLGIAVAALVVFSQAPRIAGADELPVVEVEGQPLGANVLRLLDALDYLGSPLGAETSAALRDAAVRQFPQLHTNPVNVIVGDQPIRASRNSARWCRETIELLWRNRQRRIAVEERAEAERTFQRAIARYRQLEAECPEGW